MNWIGTKNLGMLLLAIWLIASGLLTLIPITALNMGPIMALLALGAGVLILLGK